MKYLFLLLISFSSFAETSLIIPLATTHAGQSHNKFNNENHGFGLEHSHDSIAYSIVYLNENSYSEKSIYLSVSKKYKIDHNFTFYYGIAAANGYDKVTDSGILVVPVFGLQFENFRIATSFPAAQIFCPPNEDCADFVNLQAVINF